MVIFGLLALVGTALYSLGSPLFGLSGWWIVRLAAWIILDHSRNNSDSRSPQSSGRIVAVILIVIGVIAGGTGNIPAILVLLGGILGLIAWII
jgi:hypothetical protein